MGNDLFLDTTPAARPHDPVVKDRAQIIQVVWVTGIEPATCCFQNSRATTALHPVESFHAIVDDVH
jgi:hypothetical protein